MSKTLKPDQIKYYYDQALEMLSKYEHVKSSEWVKELVETCIAEQEYDTALTQFLEYIRKNGLEIETDQESIEKLMTKLFEIRFARKMVNAVGLGGYEERIINHLIDNKFSQGIAPSSIPKARKPTNG